MCIRRSKYAFTLHQERNAMTPIMKTAEDRDRMLFMRHLSNNQTKRSVIKVITQTFLLKGHSKQHKACPKTQDIHCHSPQDLPNGKHIGRGSLSKMFKILSTLNDRNTYETTIGLL